MRRFYSTLAAVVLSTVAAIAEPICVVPTTGQSPASGFGDTAQAPAPIALQDGTYGVYKFQNSAISPATEPICDACGGAPWIALANEFFIQTSTKVLLVSAAGGLLSAQAGIYYSIPYYDDGGTLTPAGFVLVDAAIAAATAAGYQPRVCWLNFFGGESEGRAIIEAPSSSIGVADFKTAFANVKRAWRDKYAANLLLVIFRTGTLTGALTNLEPGFALIRTAQEEIAEEDARVIVGTRLTTECAALYGLLQDIHPNQTCNNRLGADAARTIVSSGKWKQ